MKVPKMRPGLMQKAFLVSFISGRNAVLKTSAKYSNVKMNTDELNLQTNIIK